MIRQLQLASPRGPIMKEPAMENDIMKKPHGLWCLEQRQSFFTGNLFGYDALWHFVVCIHKTACGIGVDYGPVFDIKQLTWEDLIKVDCRDCRASFPEVNWELIDQEKGAPFA